MSIAVLIGVHDGLVLAADSASTLVINVPQGGTMATNVYDNANKIFNLIKGEPLGCVTFGSGSIGSASIATLIKDFRKKLSVRDPKSNEFKFDIKNYNMEQVAGLLADFLGGECQKLRPPELTAINIGFLVGGYSSGESLGESWSVEIKQGVPGKPLKLREKDQPGLNWGGQAEVLQRIVLGFSPRIFPILAQVSQPPPASPEELMDKLGPLLASQLQAPLVFAPMPIQDAIDLGRFLVHAATMFSRFLPGMQIVGGPIEVAAITKHEGFKWISRKHYYDQSLNREPIHVTVDRRIED
ncbi:MAG TPA: hypothetical protein VKG65_07415 [Terriglobales bacterium]|nr:hypothetical protein [Terriglobales bacterium]